MKKIKKAKNIDEKFTDVILGIPLFSTQFLILFVCWKLDWMGQELGFYAFAIFIFLVYAPYTFLLIKNFVKIYKKRKNNKNIIKYGEKYKCKVEEIIKLNYRYDIYRLTDRWKLPEKPKWYHRTREIIEYYTQIIDIKTNYRDELRNVLKLKLSYYENNTKKIVYSDIIYKYINREKKLFVTSYIN